MGGAGGKLIANMIQTQFLALNNAPLGAALGNCRYALCGGDQLAVRLFEPPLAARPIMSLRIYAIAYLDLPLCADRVVAIVRVQRRNNHRVSACQGSQPNGSPP